LLLVSESTLITDDKTRVSKSATTIHFGSKENIKIMLMEHLGHWPTAAKDWPPKSWTRLMPSVLHSSSSSLLTQQCWNYWDASEEPSLLLEW